MHGLRITFPSWSTHLGMWMDVHIDRSWRIKILSKLPVLCWTRKMINDWVKAQSVAQIWSWRWWCHRQPMRVENTRSLTWLLLSWWSTPTKFPKRISSESVHILEQGEKQDTGGHDHLHHSAWSPQTGPLVRTIADVNGRVTSMARIQCALVEIGGKEIFLQKNVCTIQHGAHKLGHL